MIKTVLVYVALITLGFMFFQMYQDYEPATELNELATQYVEGAQEDLNTQNVVTSVVVTYRGLDTLGEITVLFLATAGVGFLLSRKKKGAKTSAKLREASEIFKTSTQFLFPLIVLFGVYIFVHGHLTPGGGFQGGVLIASAFVMMMLSEQSYKINKFVLGITESLSGFFYVLIGIVGIFLAKGFLDPSFMSLGKFGMLFSAGAVPIIYSLIGLKVGSELTNIVAYLKEED
ncbi:MAG: sodium:proton antiporter [Candidatus Cloacimonetes bacterium 4572_65]|nr:MAG: sodium:proton antiporter [Candidatus Cloacimonetes bacterium 4572_65]